MINEEIIVGFEANPPNLCSPLQWDIEMSALKEP